MKAHLKRRVERYLEGRSDSRTGPQHAWLPGDERFYFPATPSRKDGASTACWTRTLSTSMPRVDFVALYELNGDQTKIRNWGQVRFEDLLGLIGDRVVWQAGRAFFKGDDWPSEDWIAAHALTDAENIALGFERMRGAR